MARPRKVTALSTGKIGKEKIAARKEQESKLKLGREELIPPKWLKKLGKEEFKRVVEETAKIDILDNLDLLILAMYCQAYEGYLDTVKILKKDGLILEKIDGQDNTIPYNHPALIAQEKFVKQIFQCSAKLGLATTDRLKLVVPTAPETKSNKFIELIDMRRKQA